MKEKKSKDKLPELEQAYFISYWEVDEVPYSVLPEKDDSVYKLELVSTSRTGF